MTNYRIYGTTDDVTECQNCGKPELKGTVMLQILDEDGNPEDLLYAGTTCAARLLASGNPYSKINGRRIKIEADIANHRRREAVQMSREFLAFYEPFERQGTDALTAEYARHNRYYSYHPETDPRARALEAMKRHREVIATDGVCAL